ncbi:DNA polymerase III subunit alpha [Aquicella lusitana]|uniref:DNA polymerase III subunit alpha n=1 Tax=Aquicella lusitana TaxID=254246 RepID=A0A370GAR0_9COXI|nr:DNA polymerase III subunit alpha [Aquicella lusitana]RDI39083.1 DNA polymerase III alpha subunit [Aquicella lusitana]VVC73482.1 DNA polymerase III subunit alpha [Aquicella lusitana]
MDLNFVHLRIHTEYSLRDGLITIPSLMEKAAAFGMPAIAITDLGNLYAIVKFYQAAISAGIKPIIGIDIQVAVNSDLKELSRLTLLCQTHEGYQNLLKLVSKSYLEGQANGQPVVQKAWLSSSLTEGLIALSGAQEGDIGQALLRHEQEKAQDCLAFWQSLFSNRFYIEVSRTGKAQEHEYIQSVVKLAESASVPVVATNDVRFLTRDDFEAHEARVCIQEGVTLNDPHRPRLYTDQQYLRSQAEMQKLFADIPEALANSVEIAKRCNVTFTLGKSQLPHFPVPAGYTTESYLSEVVKEGLEERLKNLFDTQAEDFATQRKIYDERLEQELQVINKMGFAGYFLIVADFTKWAKENGIPVGPGRGSGPGSLVAYALKITDLDPLALELLFERFLNPERVSMPDFDIDFCMEGRDRVIEYVMNKHGHDSVSQIITYGTMAAKAVVRDVGRVLGLGYGFVDKIAKLIPFELGITLDKAMEQEPLLRERYEQEEEVRTLIDLARKLEGITRNVGKHAGGIVIAPGKLTDFVPLYCEPNEASHPVTQFDKDDVEAVGLVKFDFLGLKTLTIIDRALKVINLNRARKNEAPIDISLIPLNDPESFRLLKACQSTAVFQLESHGMRDLIKRLQPDCFEDLVALVALFRPGPLQSGMVEDFINRKHGRAKVIYPHPKLEPILRPTYGTIVYQEQVMQIAQVLAGYTLGAADILRRAMGKKKPEEMAKQREIFCQGAVERGVNADVATHIFDLMEKFAGYGFNKSHSASYALIAYQTAWLKTHYPAAFMAAVLSSDMDRTEKVIVLLDECKSLKLHVSPPDINHSDYFFKVEDDKNLVYGLGAIKGVGEAAIENIIAAREQNGPFTDLFDFCQRIDLRKVNRRVLEALIKSGCFDTFGKHRASLMASLNNALQQAEQALHNETYGQHDLLGMTMNTAQPQYIEALPWPSDLQLQGEKETLGFYLTGHPLHQYLEELAHFTTCRIAELHPAEHQSACVAGIISLVRTRQTKRGDRIAIVTLDDGTTQIEMVCFADAYQKYREWLNEDQLVVIEGDVSLDEFNNLPRLVCRDLYTIDQARARFSKCLQIHVSEMAFDMQQLKSLLISHRGGNCPVVFRYENNGIKADITLGKEWLIKPAETLLSLLQSALPEAQVQFVY